MIGSVLGLVLSFSAAAVPALADTELTWPAGEPATILGTAKFARRSTLVPLAICEGPKCPKSETYWVVVLLGHDGGQYELDRAYAIGSAFAPPALTVGELEVRPGDKVWIKGTVERIHPYYALITEVYQAAFLDNI